MAFIGAGAFIRINIHGFPLPDPLTKNMTLLWYSIQTYWNYEINFENIKLVFCCLYFILHGIKIIPLLSWCKNSLMYVFIDNFFDNFCGAPTTVKVKGLRWDKINFFVSTNRYWLLELLFIEYADHGHFIWILWNKSMASIKIFIQNDHEWKILLPIQLLLPSFITLKKLRLLQQMAWRCYAQVLNKLMCGHNSYDMMLSHCYATG